MTAARGSEPPTRARWLRSIVPPVAGVVLFLATWQAGVRIFSIKAFVLPAPTEVFRHLASDPGFYVHNARVTLGEAGLGFGLGLVLALAAATVMAHVRVVEQAALPLVVLAQVTPIVAYAPAVVIWLGFGLKSIVLITSLVCFVPFVVNSVTGFRSIDPDAAELMRSVCANRREVFFRLRVPHCLPYLFSAARIAVGLALIGAVLGEYFAGVQSGLGYAVKVAQARSLVDQLWGSIYVLGFLGGVAVLFIAGLERIMLRWHSSQIGAN
jgi:NitT/TauT family transport system permease protein